MRRFAYWLFPLIAGAVALFIVIFMVQINPSIPAFSADPLQSEGNVTDEADEESGSWISRFAKTDEAKQTVYPVNEVSLELDTGGEETPAKRYRLSVPLKNSYELFCLKQELKKSGLPYFFQKGGDAMTLLVDSDDQNKLASLVTKLKTYQITATVSPYAEDH